MRIKAKMLLPRKELDDEGLEIDPRQELVQKLLEYKQFKGVIHDLQILEEERSKLFKRGNIRQDLEMLGKSEGGDYAELQSLTLFKLYNAFNKIMKQYEQENLKVKHTVVKYAYNLERQKDFVIKTLKKNDHASFEKLFSSCENRIHAIFTFLALLELVQQKSVDMKLGEGTNNFWLRLHG